MKSSKKGRATFIECFQLSASLVCQEKCFLTEGGLCIVHGSVEICLQRRDGGGKMAQRIQAPLNGGLCLIISGEGLSMAPWKEKKIRSREEFHSEQEK